MKTQAPVQPQRTDCFDDSRENREVRGSSSLKEVGWGEGRVQVCVAAHILWSTPQAAAGGGSSASRLTESFVK